MTDKCAAGDCPEPATLKLIWIDYFDRSIIWAEWYCNKDWRAFAVSIRAAADGDEDFKKRKYAQELMEINNWFQND
jgi:hypothetical protein